MHLQSWLLTLRSISAFKRVTCHDPVLPGHAIC
jgi:hypothetical protein